jgi:hypothetical protein
LTGSHSLDVLETFIVFLQHDKQSGQGNFAIAGAQRGPGLLTGLQIAGGQCLAGFLIHTLS